MTHTEEAAALQHARDLKKAKLLGRVLHACHMSTYDTLMAVAGQLRACGIDVKTRDLLEEGK